VTTTPLAAVLWDMDGTLVDTEPYWIAAEYDIVELHGGTWSEEHALSLVGADLLDSGAYIRDNGPVPLPPHEIVEMLLDRVVASVRAEMPWRPGARELLEECRLSPLPAALVTMSWRRFADPVVAALPSGSFDAVVVGDDVERGKPHPDPYLLAAKRLGVDPRMCLAIEDSPTGVASALAAGCTVLAVPNHVEVPVPDVARGRFTTRGSLSGLGLADLSALVVPLD
jgi:HAD superfamily hydrolase (TIGR01509 family)